MGTQDLVYRIVVLNLVLKKKVLIVKKVKKFVKYGQGLEESSGGPVVNERRWKNFNIEL